MIYREIIHSLANRLNDFNRISSFTQTENVPDNDGRQLVSDYHEGTHALQIIKISAKPFVVAVPRSEDRPRYHPSRQFFNLRI
jgi:hypothetical protein